MTLSTLSIVKDRLAETMTEAMMEDLSYFLFTNPMTRQMVNTGECWIVSRPSTGQWLVVGKNVTLADAMMSLNNCA